MSGERGFALAECIAAIALAGTAILIAAGLLAAHPRTSQRLQAQQMMLRQLEAAAESVRAGAVPLQSGSITGDQCQIAIEVSRRPQTAGLFEVTITAATAVRGEPVSQSLHTMIWRSP
jgi:type II secretory pathway pseudopilin PulG